MVVITVLRTPTQRVDDTRLRDVMNMVRTRNGRDAFQSIDGTAIPLSFGEHPSAETGLSGFDGRSISKLWQDVQEADGTLFVAIKQSPVLALTASK